MMLFMNTRALSHLSRISVSPPPLPLPHLSFLYLLPSNSNLGTEENKQLLLVPCCFLVGASSPSSQHGTQRHINTNMLTPVQHHILQGERCLNKYKPTSHPLWNNSGESPLIIPCKGPIYKPVSHNSTGLQGVLIELTTLSNSCPSHWSVMGRRQKVS